MSATAERGRLRWIADSLRQFAHLNAGARQSVESNVEGFFKRQRDDRCDIITLEPLSLHTHPIGRWRVHSPHHGLALGITAGADSLFL